MKPTFPMPLIFLALCLGGMGRTVRARAETVALSNVAGKKLIRVSQALVYHTPLGEVPQRVAAWQETGYDGLCFCLSIDPAVSAPAPNTSESYQYNTSFRWWDVDRRRREEFERDLQALKSVTDWGRLTDHFLWTASHVEGHKPPDWFSDEDWAIVLENARLAASMAKEVGFKGILFDMEGYGGGTYGVWRQPWDYPLYAQSDYRINNEPQPRPFAEVADKVRERGQQWAAALTSAYPDLVLFVIAGLYEVSWARARQFGKPLEETDCGLWAPFVDGLLLGLDERATLVSGSEATYLDSQYKEFLFHRDYCLNQSLAVSTVPELARKRITFAAGIWTDAGYAATGRFSDTDVRVNHRNPERHKHAVHNALAASDHYAWQWGEWGDHGESSFVTVTPTPLIREYWQANVEGHEPQDLDWEPEPYFDTTDYTAANAAAQQQEVEFWSAKEKEGFAVAVELPEFWKFRFDPEMKVRYSNWTSPDYNDASWFLLRTTSCWQSQGTYANGPGVYRVKFEIPADVNPETQEMALAFGGLGSGLGHVYFNGDGSLGCSRRLT